MTTTSISVFMTVGEDILEFSGTQIQRATLIQELNPISAELPISVFEFTILNDDGSFSMFSSDYFDLISERPPVTLYMSTDGVPALLGKFYLDNWKDVSECEFEFRAIDIIGVLAATTYDGGFWSSATELIDVLATVLNPIGVSYTIDDTIDDVEIQGWLAPNNYRKALQQICFAAGAVATTARSEDLNIIPIAAITDSYDYEVENSEKLMAQSVDLLPLVAKIELISHDYAQEAGVEEEIYNETLAIGTYKIVFQQPYYDILITGPGYAQDTLGTEDSREIVTENEDQIEVGGEFVFGPNSVYLTLTTGGEVTITGYPWVDSNRAFVFNETDTEGFANKIILKISEATMVSTNNADAVLANLIAYYRQRFRQQIILLPSAIKTGDTVLTSAFHESHVLGMVEKLSIDLVGGFLADTELCGVKYPGIILRTPGSYLVTGVDAVLTHST